MIIGIFAYIYMKYVMVIIFKRNSPDLLYENE